MSSHNWNCFKRLVKTINLKKVMKLETNSKASWLILKMLDLVLACFLSRNLIIDYKIKHLKSIVNMIRS